jgi:GNAT superfamily N-acetyltransferase
VLRYVAEHREGTPIADRARVVPGRTFADAAAAAAIQLPGWLLATDDLALSGLLVRAGATLKRHAFVMQCDLRTAVASGDIDPRFTRDALPGTSAATAWTAILPSWRAAFPPEHPDHFDGDDATAVAFIMRLVDGSELGPLHRSTTLLLDSAGTPVAGILINIRAQDPPWGGPWIADIWRDPALHGTGVGTMLIGHAQRLLVEDGHVSLGLAVSAGNSARHTYQACGFHTVNESQTVLLPAAAEPEFRFPSSQASANSSVR